MLGLSFSEKGNIMNDKEEYLKFIDAYVFAERPFELRLLDGIRGQVTSGYFDDTNIAYDLIKHDWREKTVYFTPQEIKKPIVARCKNNLKIAKRVTTDLDIANYRFIHLDIDPERPSGIQATEREVKCAYRTAKDIKEFLKLTAGFPNPIVVFSGNGTTLDYRLEKPLKANANNIELIKSFLETLAILFSDNKAIVDTTVYNPARIIKLPGTISAKGDNTEERPYRLSQILDVGDTKGGVSVSQVEEIASIGKEMKI